MKDQDIVFVTTTLNSKWLTYQRALISKFFPESQHIVIDGSSNWPYAWFYWMKDIKSTEAKWFVHIDEDCLEVCGEVGADEVVVQDPVVAFDNQVVDWCPKNGLRNRA